MQSIDNQIISRIYGHQRGWAFSKNDFVDLGGDAAIRKALSRLEAKGTIRRVIRGVYDYPRISTLLDETMGPDLGELAGALCTKPTKGSNGVHAKPVGVCSLLWPSYLGVTDIG